MSDLGGWMDRWYAAKVLSREAPADISLGFVVALRDAPALRDEARAQIDLFNRIVPDPDTLASRCFASAVKRDWLVAALTVVAAGTSP